MRKNKPIIKVLYGLTENTGYGHFKRSNVLLHSLKNKGFELASHQILGEIEQEFLKDECDLAILDTPKKPSDQVLDYIGRAKASLGLDWFFDAELDYNIIIFDHGKHPRAKREVFQGFKFVIIDKSISELKPPKNLTHPSKALVVIGGTDFHNQGYQAAKILYAQGYKVHLVLGHLHQSINLQSEDVNFKISRNVENMASLISNADIMVTNGGGCLFEAMTSGRPAIALAQSKNEQNIINFFHNQNTLVGDKIGKLYHLEKINWRKVSESANKLIDGKGRERVSSIVEKIIESHI